MLIDWKNEYLKCLCFLEQSVNTTWSPSKQPSPSLQNKKSNLKIYMKSWKTQNSQNNPKASPLHLLKSQAESITILNFKAYYESIVIKAACTSIKKWHIEQQWGRTDHRNSFMYIQPIRVGKTRCVNAERNLIPLFHCTQKSTQDGSKA